MKPVKTIRIIEVVFQVLGVVCLIGAIMSISHAVKFLKEANRSDGIVIENIANEDSDGSVTYLPVVRYTKPGGGTGTFKASIASFPPSFEVGEPVSILISKDGSIQEINSFENIWFTSLFQIGFGIAFGGIGLAFPILRKRRAAFAKYVKEMGESIETDDVKVLVNYAYSVNRRHPYFLQCRVQIDQKTMICESENMWDNPSVAINGRKIRIYYLKNEPKRYLVDIEFLSLESEKP